MQNLQNLHDISFSVRTVLQALYSYCMYITYTVVYLTYEEASHKIIQ
jgi:hypothetical protein